MNVSMCLFTLAPTVALRGSERVAFALGWTCSFSFSCDTALRRLRVDDEGVCCLDVVGDCLDCGVCLPILLVAVLDFPDAGW